MRKSRLKDGRNFFGITVEHFVTKTVFIVALRDAFLYKRDISEFDDLSKSEAKKILKDQLFFYGIEGEFPDGHFESSSDDSHILYYNRAKIWVEKNYPYLNKQ